MKSLAHWGNSQITGRGLLAVIGNGQIYQVVLKPGEEYVAHPRSEVGRFLITCNYTEDKQQRGSLHGYAESASTVSTEVFSTSVADTWY